MSRDVLESLSAGVADPTLLADAFKKFNLASERLEERYQQLLSETERLREEVREKDLEVKRATRLAMLGETAAAIAHEVRNPLGAIQLFLSLLREDLADNPRSLELVDQIHLSTQAINHVVSNILQFSREQEKHFSPVNLHSLVREQIAHFEIAAPEVEFTFVGQGTQFVQGDEHGLRQVLRNLILNSLQAMRFKGVIHISVRSESQSTVLLLKDSGPGVSEGLSDTLFDPFVTSRNEGTGLGLAVVRQILSQHRASISTWNDDGACFQIEFQRSSAKVSNGRE